ncbi:hypothetical protein DFH08DRAFT_970689 [Mycena albidolilacea]|uniref:Uncharacterized protein n=1 Tax=Mycena albidolilacea TaxID=1033008 RepID=A0AAD7EFP8_9AGAR|nr:hypothetical protein DFH08DRAFT_970689 [Mycena albidolilacea]
MLQAAQVLGGHRSRPRFAKCKTSVGHCSKPRYASSTRASRPHWDTAQDRAKSSRPKSLKSHIDAHQVLALLAPQDLIGRLLKISTRVKYSRLKTSVGYCSRRANSSRCKSLKSHITRAKISRLKTSVGHCSRHVKSSRCKSLKSHMTRVKVSRLKTSVGYILLRTRQILVLQEPQELHDTRQSLAPQDLSGILLKTR